MLLPTFIYIATAMNVELIDHMKLTYSKNAQITRTSLKIVRALQIYPKACVTHSFS